MKIKKLTRLFFLTMPLLLGCHKDQSANYKAIEQKIQQTLPIGTPMEKVNLYLTNQKIGHSFYTNNNQIYAMVSDLNSQSGGIIKISESLSVVFSFDTNNVLTNVQSKIEYTGP